VFRIVWAHVSSVKRVQANEPAPDETDTACACKLTKFLMASLMDVCEGEEGEADAVVQRLGQAGWREQKMRRGLYPKGRRFAGALSAGIFLEPATSKRAQIPTILSPPSRFCRVTHHAGTSVEFVTDFNSD
jgi:hypothetical protein